MTYCKQFNSSLAAIALLASFPALTNAQDIDEVQVIGVFIPDEKRNTSEISNVLESEDFSLAGDSDIAVALTRLPGLSPDTTGKYVVVRGLTERYTSTLLNGTQLPSPDPLKTAVPLDIFPTSIIGNVLVQKTYSAEYPGAFGGGVIDLRTKSVPDEPFLNISLSTGYNSESTTKDGFSYYGSDRDWLTFDDGHRELPSIFRNDYQLTSLTPASLEQYGEAIPNIWSIDFDENKPDLSAKISGGTSRDTANGVVGMIFALDYSSEYRNQFGEQFSYSATNDGLVIQQNFSNSVCENQSVSTQYCGFNTTSWNTNLNGLLSVGWEIDSNNEIKYTGVLLRSSQKQVQIKGGSTDSNDLENTTRLDWKEREVISNAVSGEHTFDLIDAGETMVDWSYNITNATRDVPLRRRYKYFYDDGPGAFRISTRTDGNLTEYGYMEDESRDLVVNLTQVADIFGFETDIKLGAAYNEKERSSYYLTYHYNMGQITNRDLLFRVPEVIFGSTNIDPNGIYLQSLTRAADSFSADFENAQAYWQIDTRLTDTIRVSSGYRYEDSEQLVRATDRSTLTPLLVTQQIESFLPSATVTWEFAENMQLRFGYSETINRPDSRELSPARFIREDGRTEEGNPNLQFAEIKNYDARYEWYFGDSDSLTVGVFYKDITNPIEYSIASIGGEGQLDTVANADEAELTGIELEIEKQLGTRWNRDLFVKANATYIDSEVMRSAANFGEVTNLEGPMQGQSEILANVQFGFENLESNEFFNIVLNYVDERIYRLGTNSRPDLIEKPPFELNVVYSRDIYTAYDRPVGLSVKLKNLLDEGAERLQGSEIAEAYDIGTTLSIGLNYSF